MNACFPDLYHDESLYSGCARYSERIPFPSPRYVIRSLFGNRVRRLDVNLPRHLRQFIASLPPGHSLTVKVILENHTLLPYYRAFREEQWAKQVEAVMTEEQQRWGGQTIRSRHSWGRHVTWLRLCLRCADEDRQRNGEAYWHRLHQVPGYLVCSRHAVFLRNSPVRGSLRHPDAELITAEHIIKSGVPLPVDPDRDDHRVLLRLSNDIEWVLNNNSPFGQKIQNGYIAALAQKGFITAKTHLKRTALFQAFLNTYQRATLDLLGDAMPDVFPRGGLQHWLFCSPLYHLLTMQLLGYTAEQFAAVCRDAVSCSVHKEPLQLRDHKDRQEPFGKGPWPCLNKAAAHFQNSVVTRCCVHIDKQKRIVGEFFCTCGHVFVRRGPDRSQVDQFRIGKVRNFGSVWDQRLIAMWEDASFSHVSIAQLLGVDRYTVKRQALRLGLDLSQKRIRVAPPPYKMRGVARKNLNEACETMRHALEKYPRQSRVFFYKLLPKTCSLLWRRDREWFMRHLPVASIDWPERDATIAQRIGEAAQRLSEKPGKPVQITRQRLLREIHVAYLPHNVPERMPLVTRALNKMTETREAFVARRRAWVMKCAQRSESDENLVRRVHQGK